MMLQSQTSGSLKVTREILRNNKIDVHFPEANVNKAFGSRADSTVKRVCEGETMLVPD